MNINHIVKVLPILLDTLLYQHSSRVESNKSHTKSDINSFLAFNEGILNSFGKKSICNLMIDFPQVSHKLRVMNQLRLSKSPIDNLAKY